MTPQEFANLITNREYPFHITAEEQELARNNHLVVLWGQSDDLLELRGLACDEAGAYDGTKARFDIEGFLPVDASGIINDSPKTIHECIDIVNRWKQSFEVKAEWCPKGTNLSWRITVDEKLEAAKFVVLEDDQPMCEGVVTVIPALS